MDNIKPRLIPRKYLKKFIEMVSSKKNNDLFWSYENIILIIFFIILIILLFCRYCELKKKEKNN